MKLYQVSIDAPVLWGTYYVLADGLDEAARMAIEADHSTGGHNAGILKIEVVGRVGDDDDNLLISDAGLRALGVE